MRVVLAVALALGACSGSDATRCTPARAYRITAVDLPIHSGDGTRLGLDLDGDGRVDNALGNVFSAVVSADGTLGGVSATASTRLASGAVPWTLVIDACDDGTARVEPLPMPLTVIVDPLGTFDPIAWTPVLGVRSAPVVDGEPFDGVLAFGLPMPAAKRDLLAPYAAYITEELQAGRSPFGSSCDANHDGVCTVDELLTPCDCCAFCSCCPEPLLDTLLLPDVTLDGTHALSGGIGIHAELVAQ